VTMATEVAVLNDAIAVTVPGSPRELEQLFAEGVAEVIGASRVEDRRSLALLILPLLQSRTVTEAIRFLERQGIAWKVPSRVIEGQSEPEHEIDGEDQVDSLKDAIAEQLFGSLNGSKEGDEERAKEQHASGPKSEADGFETAELQLPPLDDVTPVVLPDSGQWVPAERSPRNTRSGTTRANWAPRSPAEMAQDLLLGDRGEAIVYRLELDRVRALGYEKPEAVVTWTSQNDRGADHDIRSIAEDGRPLWIEVKATVGTHGNFSWPRNEFERALRNGTHYELCRVYESHTTQPTIKRFRDPVRLVTSGALRIDLATLRAALEPMEAGPPTKGC
jgi:hypothetical protein